MTENKTIRGLIAEYFSYLVTDHDFIDDTDIHTHDIYSEVRFKKNDWRVSVAITEHGTKISMKLISPVDDFGFLSHYFNTVDKEYKKAESETKNLEDSLRYYSEFLRIHGPDILKADSARLTKILELIKVEHDKWIKPLMKRNSDA
jgi:hypothetical protein